MAMVNHVEAIYTAKYLQNYLDCVDYLPVEIQRLLTQIREVDLKIRELETDTLPFEEVISNLSESETIDSKFISQLQVMLIKMQEFEDEKIQLSTNLIDLIENRGRQLDQDRENLDPSNHIVSEPTSTSRSNNTTNKRSSTTVDTKTTNNSAANGASNNDSSKDNSKQSDNRQSSSVSKKRKQKSDSTVSSTSRNTSVSTSKTNQSQNASSNTNSGGTTPAREKDDSSNKKTATPYSEESSSKPSARASLKRKRRSKVGSQTKNTPTRETKEPSLEPEEPTYCLCDQISYGEMIGCDNDACSIEWFHFNCVGLVNKPKGRWYCPKCRGDKPTVMKKSDKR